MRPEWALAVRDRCEAAGVAFFFKQWGGWGADGVRRDQQANGRVLAGPYLGCVSRTCRRAALSR